MRKWRHRRWWLATLAMAMGVAITLALGSWQMDRAAQKKRWQAHMQVQAQATPITHEQLRQAQQASDWLLTPWLHRPVQLQGQWLAAQTVYLDNRQMRGRPGFYVLTPLQLEGGGIVMVQRGWIARNFHDRQALQPITTPLGAVQVTGKVAGVPARLYALGEAHTSGSADVDSSTGGVDAQAPIRQNLDLDAYAQRTGLALWPFTVVELGPDSDGLLRDWPQADAGIATHYGYAFQWFAIAAVLAALLAWFQFLRPVRAARARHAATSHSA